MVWLIVAILVTVPSVTSFCRDIATLTASNCSYIFSTPNYPNRHDPEEDCIWLVNAPDNIVELKLQCNIDIKSSPNCSSASFEFHSYRETGIFCETTIISITIEGAVTLFSFKSSMSEIPSHKGVRCIVYYNPQDIPTGTTPVDHSCTCGDKGGKRIIDGKETETNEYPWQALLMLRPAMRPYCGGALIARQWVLSAGHCIPHEPSRILVVLGEHNIKSCDSERQYFEVIDTIKHEGFSYMKKGSNDIALLQLAEPVADNPFISPICLPFNFKHHDFTDKVGITTGWGWTTESDKYSNSMVLKESKQKIIMPFGCTWLDGYFWIIAEMTPNKICGLYENGIPHLGDTGCPLVWMSDLSNRYFLIGVTGRFRKHPLKWMPFIYTRVSQFVDWIEDKIRARAELCVKI